MLLNKDHKLNVLVLCTGNSARSIIGEALFNSQAGGYFKAYSAGSKPAGKVNPFALEQIADLDLDFEPRSKNWNEFEGQAAPRMDIVITVCDNAAQESCPVFMGVPVSIHWGLPDPAAVTGSDDVKRQAFADCYKALESLIADLIETLGEDK